MTNLLVQTSSPIGERRGRLSLLVWIRHSQNRVTLRSPLRPLPWGEGGAERRVRGTQAEERKLLVSLYYEMLNNLVKRGPLLLLEGKGYLRSFAFICGHLPEWLSNVPRVPRGQFFPTELPQLVTGFPQSPSGSRFHPDS